MAANDDSGNIESKDVQAPKTTPKDALVMAAILKEMGVAEYEPRIINQMVEFAYRYITDTIEDARVYSLHANRKTITLDDVKLAVAQRLDHSFTSPPPREFLLEVARKKNSQPLPLISERNGLRLPPDRYCLTGNNYKLKSGIKKVGALQQRRASSTSSQAAGKPAAKANPLPTLSLAPSPVSQQQAVNPAMRNQPGSASALGSSMQPQMASHPSLGLVQSGMPSQSDFPSVLKRKRELDDDYDT